MSELAEAWQTSNEASLYLLSRLSRLFNEALDSRYSERMQTVAWQFVHMHSVRRRWLERMAPNIDCTVPAFVRGATPSGNGANGRVQRLRRR